MFRFALQFQQLFLRINQKGRVGRRQLELLSRAVEQQHAHFLFQRGDIFGVCTGALAQILRLYSILDSHTFIRTHYRMLVSTRLSFRSHHEI